MKIYTKTGDTGTTGLYGGQRIGKDALRMQAIGDIDELNAYIGVCRTHSADMPIDGELAQVQHWLFDIGAELATPQESKASHAKIGQTEILWLESSMDEHSDSLDPLKNFILPGGCALASHLHVARAVCRRAERTLVALSANEAVRSELLVCINRLSDWFFVTARVSNRLSHVEDVKWNPRG